MPFRLGFIVNADRIDACLSGATSDARVSSPCSPHIIAYHYRAVHISPRERHTCARICAHSPFADRDAYRISSRLRTLPNHPPVMTSVRPLLLHLLQEREFL